MAEIKEFKAIYYNPGRVSLSNVVSPPYDIIDDEKKKYLNSLSEYNVVRLILNDSSPNPYREAACLFEDWLAKGILVFDDQESLYIYAQRFRYNSQEYTRYGFIGLLKLEEPGDKVLPHERTYAGPKEDRFKLLKEVRANLSPVFTIFPDSEKNVLNLLVKVVRDIQPLFNFEFDDMENTVWKISSPQVIRKIKTALRDKPILIADGHHRYEVALWYRNLMRSQEDFPEVEPFDYCMCYFAPIEQEGLLILPTHRMVKLTAPWESYRAKLEESFNIIEVKSAQELFKEMSEGEKRFGFYNKRFYLLEFRDKEILRKEEHLDFLDVNILHKFILGEIINYRGEISYIEDAYQAIRLVEEGKYSGVFFLNPTPIADIIKVVQQNMRMPQKSTYFYPKILTGITFYKF
ncbi:MAG: hypothetical protein B6D53_00470 [Candidatus Omnitrophica bacterium 4484_49]|nr:MAG: hypothetical protein B6D53_00470 [Candidatus Omnitrophica bacterium 4484_49]